MAAPLGFKTFNTGDVLSAADTNGYLMQGVLVFADAAARSAAITSPQEGQTSYLKDTDVIQVYSGSAWVTKSGGSSPLTTKGDLYTYSTTDARLPVGTNGHTLVADSAEATGLKWQAPTSSSGPAFKAYKSAGQSITGSTFTKVTFDTEDFDTASNFASNRFTPTTAGYYQISAFAEMSGTGTLTTALLTIYKNGVRAGDCFGHPAKQGGYSDLFYANGSSDYFEVYVYITFSGGFEVVDGVNNYRSRFAGVWIRS